jgi:hypothetical protein
MQVRIPVDPGKEKRRRAYACAVEDFDSPAGSCTNHRKMKKGAGASPLFLELTPQNRNPSRGWVPATPGSQSCFVGEE